MLGAGTHFGRCAAGEGLDAEVGAAAADGGTAEGGEAEGAVENRPEGAEEARGRNRRREGKAGRDKRNASAVREQDGRAARIVAARATNGLSTQPSLSLFSLHASLQ